MQQIIFLPKFVELPAFFATNHVAALLAKRSTNLEQYISMHIVGIHKFEWEKLEPSFSQLIRMNLKISHLQLTTP